MGNIPGEKSLSRVSAEPKIKDHMTGSHCRLLALTFFYLFSMGAAKICLIFYHQGIFCSSYLSHHIRQHIIVYKLPKWHRLHCINEIRLSCPDHIDLCQINALLIVIPKNIFHRAPVIVLSDFIGDFSADQLHRLLSGGYRFHLSSAEGKVETALCEFQDSFRILCRTRLHTVNDLVSVFLLMLFLVKHDGQMVFPGIFQTCESKIVGKADRLALTHIFHQDLKFKCISAGRIGRTCLGDLHAFPHIDH